MDEKWVGAADGMSTTADNNRARPSVRYVVAMSSKEEVVDDQEVVVDHQVHDDRVISPPLAWNDAVVAPHPDTVIFSFILQLIHSVKV